MPLEIKAAVLRKINQPLSVESFLLDDPRDDEVLIEVRASGICHSDLHYIDGSLPRPLPSILGHEAAGVVLSVGSAVKSLKVGDHVVPLFCPECRECANCTSGKTNYCLRQGALNSEPRIWQDGKPVYRSSLGTFATHALLPEIAVSKIRSDAPFDRVFYCGCGVTTGVGAVMFDAKVERDSTVVVFGVGGIGLNVLQGARLAGARMIVAVDTNQDRESNSRKFGATHFVNPHKIEASNLVAELTKLTGGGADYTFECIGNVTVMQQAFEASNPFWGLTTIVGIAAHDSRTSLNPMMFLTGRRIKGSIFGGAKGRTDLPKVVDWYMNGAINIDDLVTHRLSLEQINEGFDLLKAGKSIRSVMIL
jgi:S-(hydroxymethyl)glutathione dehydrogenase / alcohol dehydrogenase